jgi:hypothetical protein
MRGFRRIGGHAHSFNRHRNLHYRAYTPTNLFWMCCRGESSLCVPSYSFYATLAAYSAAHSLHLRALARRSSHSLRISSFPRAYMLLFFTHLSLFARSSSFAQGSLWVPLLFCTSINRWYDRNLVKLLSKGMLSSSQAFLECLFNLNQD